jgi:NADPH:quinone reductase
MRALRIVSYDGPGAVEVASDVSEPRGDDAVVVEVRAAGVSFPEVLQTRGEYQVKPDLPYVPGGEVAGVVRSAPEDSGLGPGDRVVAGTLLGGFAEVAMAPPFLTFPLPDALDFAQGAGLIINYHTAWFALKMRGALREGESVLVHGGAGGVGTAAIQVARGLGARTIAVVSSDEKELIAREAGADEVVRSDGRWREDVLGLTDGGVDVVFDPVGGDRFLDSLRVLREDGRLLVIGFAAGDIPEVRVNRLLLRNTSLVGVFWGGYVMAKPDLNREIGARVAELVDSGAIRPIVGARFPLERGADALRLLDERGATGKVVLEL